MQDFFWTFADPSEALKQHRTVQKQTVTTGQNNSWAEASGNHRFDPLRQAVKGKHTLKAVTGTVALDANVIVEDKATNDCRNVAEKCLNLNKQK